MKKFPISMEMFTFVLSDMMVPEDFSRPHHAMVVHTFIQNFFLYLTLNRFQCCKMPTSKLGYLFIYVTVGNAYGILDGAGSDAGFGSLYLFGSFQIKAGCTLYLYRGSYAGDT